MIINNKTGFTFQNGNKDDLLKKIVYIVDNIKNMNDIRKRARIEVIEKYRWEINGKKLQKIYENVKNIN